MQTLPQLVAVVGVLVTGKLDTVPETIGSLHHGLLDACIPKYIRSVRQGTVLEVEVPDLEGSP